jgi:RHS repeat-associated protein
MRSWFGLVACFLLLTACHSGSDTRPDSATASPVGELTEEDTILVNDLLGTPILELTGSGKPIGRFSSYPFGGTRMDTSSETQKYAGAPRDTGVSLDAMGARFYAPTFGVWTRADPFGVTSPEHFVTADFAASNPYAYAKDSPLLVADRDGHFWNIAIGAAVGGLVGGGMEAGRQYWATGRIESWGRVGAAASGGAISGAITAACPVAGLSGFFGGNAVSGAAGGMAQRLVESGGQSAGTLKEAVFDAGMSVATAGLMKGGGAIVKAVVKRAPATARIANELRSAADRAPQIHAGKQGKHIVGHNNFESGRSILRADPEVLALRAGTGAPANSIPVGQPGSRERIVFDHVIGQNVDGAGVASDTRVGIIHYSKDGIHIVPGKPQ